MIPQPQAPFPDLDITSWIKTAGYCLLCLFVAVCCCAAPIWRFCRNEYRKITISDGSYGGCL